MPAPSAKSAASHVNSSHDPPPSTAFFECLLHRHDPVGEHVVEQEEEDARRHAAERNLQANVRAPNPARAEGR